jgi:hypothetical protein
MTETTRHPSGSRWDRQILKVESIPAPTAVIPAPTAVIPAPTAVIPAPTAVIPAPTAVRAGVFSLLWSPNLTGHLLYTVCTLYLLYMRALQRDHQMFYKSRSIL